MWWESNSIIPKSVCGGDGDHVSSASPDIDTENTIWLSFRVLQPGLRSVPWDNKIINITSFRQSLGNWEQTLLTDIKTQNIAQKDIPLKEPVRFLGRPCRFHRPRKTRVTWRSFKERQAVCCWRGAGGERAGSLAVNLWCWSWGSGAFPRAPHQSPPVRREPPWPT